MAMLYVPHLGEPNMCETECTHSDCAAMREDFIQNANCVVCGEPLKEGDAFVYTGEAKYSKAHYHCTE
jgi:hypothetical protein